MVKRQQRGVDKWKTKKWFNIVAPEMFGRAPAGETPASSESLLPGRRVEMTLGDLTGDPSKHHMKLIFEITGVSGDTASTKFIAHTITRDYMRSLIKRRTSKVDSNTVVETKDGYRLRVKASAYTLKRARRRQIKAIRAVMNEEVTQRAKMLTLNEFIREAVLGKLASDIYRKGKQIYPLRRVEIYKTRVLSEPSPGEVEIEETASEGVRVAEGIEETSSAEA
ncbi:MAG: 30S ribosomal protein S3ae [Candidatus Syntrophoarchaeum sp. WYZ-LMO15]|nr:MAG: 30S ribosomal protein S3ae [Candidatus Syntrophoarchaeum sp. WYZ-LMO15]